METFFRLHDARWADRGGSSSAGPRVRAFHRDFAAAALARGWLRLWFLEIDGEPAASWYGWRIGSTYAYYLAGFSPAWSRYNVGSVLLAHTIRSALEEGATTYDLLLGSESYKSRLASGQQPVQTVVLSRARHPTRLLVAAETALWRAGRRLPPERRARARSIYRRLAGRLPTARRR
jgi:CelD/BcsL family acetyltransferase involved in cellulose biosynthesis